MVKSNVNAIVSALQKTYCHSKPVSVALTALAFLPGCCHFMEINCQIKLRGVEIMLVGGRTVERC